MISEKLATNTSKMLGFGLDLLKASFGLYTPHGSTMGGKKTGKDIQPIDSGTAAMANEVLGLIYRELVKAREDEKLTEQTEIDLYRTKFDDETKRHNDIMKVLTGKKVTKKTSKKETPTPKEQPKETTKESPKVEKVTPKETPTAKPVPKETPTPKVEKIPATPKIPGAAIAAAAAGALALSSSVIAKEEGLPKGGKAYYDPPNQKKLISIGYGHQIKEDEYNQGFIQIGTEKVPLKGDRGIDTVLTKDQAQKLLEVDVPRYEKSAREPLGDSWNKLNDKQKAALTSYAYNVGSTKSLVKAGLKEAIDAGDTELAAKIIEEKGIKTSGGVLNTVLQERRKKEAKLFSSEPLVKTQPIPTEQVTGNKIDQSSKENKTLKEKDEKKTSTNVNNVNVLNKPTESDSTSMETFNDRPVYQQKLGK